jgi:hypothetical protein
MSTRKYLIVRPKYGLCNQLYSISKGIIFALISDRDIFFSSFQIDYRDENNLCEFHNIIDVEHLQKIIDKYNINVRIFSDMGIKGKKIETNDDTNISLIKDFIPLLFLENNVNERFLDIDNPISAVIPDEYKLLNNYVDLNIKFIKKFIDIANEITQQLNLKNYCCIHLRLEDDAVRHMKDLSNKDLDMEVFNNVCKKKYLDELDNLKVLNVKIYICTSLIIDKHANNEFYLSIKEKYNLIDKNNIVDTDSECDCREIYGIIDFIIAKNSLFFIGTDWSSFSLYLYNMHKSNKKMAKLINVWEDISKL